MDEQLQKLEAEYLKLFTGVSMQKSFKKSFTFLPKANDIGKSVPLFQLSKQKDFTLENDRSSQNVNVIIENNEVTKGILKFSESTLKAVNNSGGYYYRIPEYADIKLVYKNKIIFKSNKRINQFGVISRTPSFNSKIEFYQNTGSIKKIFVN